MNFVADGADVDDVVPEDEIDVETDPPCTPMIPPTAKSPFSCADNAMHDDNTAMVNKIFLIMNVI